MDNLVRIFKSILYPFKTCIIKGKLESIFSAALQLNGLGSSPIKHGRPDEVGRRGLGDQAILTQKMSLGRVAPDKIVVVVLNLELVRTFLGREATSHRSHITSFSSSASGGISRTIGKSEREGNPRLCRN